MFPQYCAPSKPSLRVLTVDAATRAPLAGAIFELHEAQCPLLCARSATDGFACFCELPPGCYVLYEVEAPPGYEANCETYAVEVDGCNNVTVNQQDTNPYTIAHTALPA